MTKKEIMQQYLASQLPQLRCPICHEPFQALQEQALICAHQHSFDISKRGSVFFLNAPVKTEYSTEMLVQRRLIIEAGLFDPVLAEIKTRLKGDVVIDAGCGEGSQIKKIAQAQPGHYFAFDISKPAINLAVSGTHFQKNVAFFVADLAQMPFSDHRFTDLINFLSPANYQEFRRVLQPGGQLLKVMPNADYLQELRHLVYPTGQHAAYDPQPVQAHFLRQFPNAHVVNVRYTFELTPTLATALFAMTPLTWQADNTVFETVDQLNKITVDLQLATVNI